MEHSATIPTISETRIEKGTAPVGKKMSEIFSKKGRWKNDTDRLSAEQIRKTAWLRNNEK